MPKKKDESHVNAAILDHLKGLGTTAGGNPRQASIEKLENALIVADGPLGEGIGTAALDAALVQLKNAGRIERRTSKGVVSWRLVPAKIDGTNGDDEMGVELVETEEDAAPANGMKVVVTPHFKKRKHKGIEVTGTGQAGKRRPEKMVIAIREARKGGGTIDRIAADFGASWAAVNCIVRGTTYRDVGGPIEGKDYDEIRRRPHASAAG